MSKTGTYITTIDGVKFFTDRVVKGEVTLSAKVGYLEYNAIHDVYARTWSESTGIGSSVKVGKGQVTVGVNSDGDLTLGGGIGAVDVGLVKSANGEFSAYVGAGLGGLAGVGVSVSGNGAYNTNLETYNTIRVNPDGSYVKTEFIPGSNGVEARITEFYANGLPKEKKPTTVPVAPGAAAEMAAGLAPHIWDGAWDKHSADRLGNDGIASGVRSDSSYFGDIPTHRPARTNDGVKNDTYNGQTSGPNRGLGDGGNKAAGTSSKAPSNKSDGSYFSDFGGGGGSAGQQARTGNDPSGPSRSEPSRSGGSEAGQSARRGNDPTGPSRSEPSRSDKTDKGQSPKNDTHNGQKSGPNRGLGDGGKSGSSKSDGGKSGSNKSDSGKSGSSKSDSGKSGSSKSDGGESARRGNDPAGPNRSKPIILDLDGDGIEITELSRSNVFMDSGGDGLLHRTAWAGAGDGVLFFDANGDNKIGETREYVFTEWDPTAASDLAALRAAFDRNGDGRLTAADINFFKFKVLVTNADGSQTARTLTELGIREIGLLGDATHIALPDGSVITGQASFTRTNGTTGTVADVILVADAEGRRVVQTITTDAAGTRTVVSQAYDADGSVSSAAVVNRTVTDTARPGTFSSKFPWRHEGCKQLQRCSGGVRAFLP